MTLYITWLGRRIAWRELLSLFMLSLKCIVWPTVWRLVYLLMHKYIVGLLTSDVEIQRTWVLCKGYWKHRTLKWSVIENTDQHVCSIHYSSPRVRHAEYLASLTYRVVTYFKLWILIHRYTNVLNYIISLDF